MNLKETIRDAEYEPRTYTPLGAPVKECLAVHCDDPLAFVAALIEAVEPEDLRMLASAVRGMKIQPMRSGFVAYFPEVQP